LEIQRISPITILTIAVGYASILSPHPDEEERYEGSYGWRCIYEFVGASCVKEEGVSTHYFGDNSNFE
jgi:hypothetical protein